MSDNPLIKAFIKLHEGYQPFEEKVGPRTNQPASTTSSAEGLAMGRGAVNNITMGGGKYFRAGADYAIKNLGSLAGMSEPTTFNKELEQEKEKDTAAQQDYPAAYDMGDKLATAAQMVSGVGAIKVLGKEALKAGLRSAVAKNASQTIVKNADANDFELGMRNALDLTKQMRVPTANDFELGMRNALDLTKQMRVPTTPLKLTPNQMISGSRKIVPFPKKIKLTTEEENESSKENAEMSTNLFIKGFLRLHEKVGPRPPNANTAPAPPITNANTGSSISTISLSPRPQPNPRNTGSNTSTISLSPRPQPNPRNTGSSASTIREPVVPPRPYPRANPGKGYVPPITNANTGSSASTIREPVVPKPNPRNTVTNPPPPIASNRTFNRTTVKGDSLWNMVKKPGMSNADIANEVDRVAKLNKLASPDKIQIGQKLNFGEENESSKENTEMSINPFIKGFFDIEEARAKNTNIFDESKKLTAAQKKHLDKNNNDKIDAEDFKMLRKKSYNEQATPRMTADQVKAASKGGSPNPTAQKEFDDTVAGAEQKVDVSKFLIKQGLKYAGKSVAGPIGGLIGSALGSIVNKKIYNEEETIEEADLDEAKKTNSMVMARNISKALKAVKPDFLDIDKDGDKEESMKKASADMKKEEVGFSEEEIDFINSVMEAMPVAPTSENDSPNPTPKKKAEGSRAKGSMSD